MKSPSSASTGGRHLQRHLFAVCLVSVAIFLAYSNCLHGTWALDDVVVSKPVSLKDVNDLLGFRKLAYFTFLLNQQIAPFNTLSFRLFNVIIHICNALLVYLLAYRTMMLALQNRGPRIPGGRNEAKAGDGETKAFWAAVFSSIAFGLHPLNINAVAYIVQRMASLAALFVLLSLLSYIAASRSSGGALKFLLYCASASFAVAGIFSKESALLIVPLLLLYDMFFLSRGSGRLFAKKVLIIAVIGIVCAGVASYFLHLHRAVLDVSRILLHFDQPIPNVGWTATDVYWTPVQHLYTAFRVVSRYLLLLVAPLPQFLMFDWWGFSISKSLIEPATTLPSVLLVLALLLFSIILAKRFPLLSFGILWYFIALSAESFFALGSDLYFEHRNYLPLAGLLPGVIGQLLLSSKGAVSMKRFWAGALVLCITLGSLTYWRNFVWKDSFTLWGDTIRKEPRNLRALMAMGNAYLTVLDFDDAARYYKTAVKIASEDKRPHFLNDAVYSLGMLHLFKGELNNAGELIEKLDSLMQSYRIGILRGFYKSLTNDIPGALRDYQDVIGMTEGLDTVVVYTLMGDAYRRIGSWDQALERYRNALSLDPAFPAAYYGMGASHLAKQNTREAEEYLQKALLLEPNNVLALSDMADLLLITGADPRSALAYARKAVSRPSPFSQPYATMGNVLTLLGKETEANEYYGKAVERGMERYLVPFSKARVYYLKGDMQKVHEQLQELRGYEGLPENVKALLKQAGNR